MDNYWIKALGGGPRIGRIPDDWRDVDDALFERAVTFAQRSSIEPGDKIVLYAAGWGAFFALGTAQSYPYPTEGEDPWRWHVDIELERSVPFVHHGLPLRVLNVDGRDLRVAMRRRSHIRLSGAEYEAAAEGLAEKQRILEQRSGR